MKHSLSQLRTFAVGGALLVMSASAAHADLTRQGAVGLPLNPTAQIPTGAGVRLQANYFGGGDAKVSGLYAAGRLGGALEVSGGLERSDASGVFAPFDESSFAIGAKYQLTGVIPNPTGIQVAVGAGHSRAQFRNTHAYLVGSSPLPGLSRGLSPARAHLGLRYDNFDTNVPLLGGSNKASVYGGLEVPISPDGRTSFVGELQTRNSNNDSARNPYSAGVRYRAGNFTGTVGALRDGFTGNNGLYAQLGARF